jgi:hypothetical protein
LKHALAIHTELNDPLKRATLEFNLAALKLEADASALPLALAALEGLKITKDDALIALCTLEVALLCDHSAQKLELADRALVLSSTPQTRLLQAIVHADANAIEAALQSNLHETGLAYATLHTLIERTAPPRANENLELWRAQLLLETTDLTSAHRAGRLRYYARRVPGFNSAHFAAPTELTLA